MVSTLFLTTKKIVELRNVNKNSRYNLLISDIKRLYFGLRTTDILVWVSSFAFLSWFLFDILLPAEKETIATIVILLLGARLIYIIINAGKIKSRDIEHHRSPFVKTFNIAGSFLVLFLFINSYLKISESINQKFLLRVENLETAFSAALFSIFFTFVFFLLAIYFLHNLKEIMREEIGERKIFWKEIILVVLFFFVFSFILLIFEKHLVILAMKLFFGSSLIFLHLSYLIKEIKPFLKQNYETIKNGK